MNPETQSSQLSASTLRVCINQAQDGLIGGQVYSAQMSEPFSFSDFGRLTLHLDALMDEQNYPQSFQRKRLFRGCQGVTLPASLTEPPLLSVDQVFSQKGKLATVDLQILSRQNATWQGRIFFPQEEANTPLPFQSALEMLHIIEKHFPC